ncbi:hypothetical protein [Alkaliphilus crotonatoxidans]
MTIINDMVTFGAKFIYYTIPIATVIIVIVLIKKNIEQRTRIANDLICLSSPDSFKLVFAFIISSFYLIVLTKLFIPSFTKVFEITIPQYFDGWYQLLWVANIRSLSYRLLVNDMLREASILIGYDVDLVFFIIISSLLFVIPYLIYQGLQKSMICQSGVLVSNKLIKWEDFQCAKWEGPIEKNNKAHYFLWLYIGDSRRSKNWDDPFNTLKLKVKAEDRERINSLIEANNQ